MALYDAIGKTYAHSRRSDPRIAAKLLEILAPYHASTIVDIGAGTGSYAFALAENGYRVLAVEPSETMRSQAISSAGAHSAIAHPGIQWINACGEKLPLLDQSADVAIIMLAFHHLQNYRKVLQEIYRVTNGGQVVLFTYDPEMISSFWLTQYFPSFITDVQSTFLPIATLTSTIESIFNAVVNITPFPLPNDLLDSFAAVGWSRPELYLEKNIRNGISSFAKLTDEELEQGLSRLCQDLKIGVWNYNYGHLRQQKQYDVGYRFLYTIS